MNDSAISGQSWIESPSHHRWLEAEADRLLTFHERHAFDAPNGFLTLDRNGFPDKEAPKDLYATARLVHSFSLAHLCGRPGAEAIAEHGVKAMLTVFLDQVNDGWYSSLAPNDLPLNDRKEAYTHAFVLLAASSALQAGIERGDELFALARGVLDDHFWRDGEGVVVDSWDACWLEVEPYRGQNSNMHLTEAYMAAFEASHDDIFLARAIRISERLIKVNAAAQHWLVPEHYDTNWVADPHYNAAKPKDPFRPFGSLVGHSLEWSRLLLQLHSLAGPRVAWAPEAAVNLFDRAIADGWDRVSGGLYYSVDLAGNPINRDRFHWTIAEAIGASVYLYRYDSQPQYETWYRRFWNYAERYLIDREAGSWWHQLDADSMPTFDTWAGKPDLYHALQATFYARSSAEHGLVETARLGLVK